MKVNGQVIKLMQHTSLLDFLQRSGYDSAKVAVERNGDIVKRVDFEKTLLTDEDILEIVNFVGGG